jgi:hypothetical protein
MRCHRQLIDTVFTIFASENRSYLGEFESEFKKTSARESGDKGVLFDENLVTLSFKGKIQQKYSMANIPYYTST